MFTVLLVSSDLLGDDCRSEERKKPATIEESEALSLLLRSIRAVAEGSDSKPGSESPVSARFCSQRGLCAFRKHVIGRLFENPCERAPVMWDEIAEIAPKSEESQASLEIQESSPCWPRIHGRVVRRMRCQWGR